MKREVRRFRGVILSSEYRSMSRVPLAILGDALAPHLYTNLQAPLNDPDTISFPGVAATSFSWTQMSGSGLSGALLQAVTQTPLSLPICHPVSYLTAQSAFLLDLNNGLNVLAAGELGQLSTQGQILVNYVIVSHRAWNS